LRCPQPAAPAEADVHCLSRLITAPAAQLAPLPTFRLGLRCNQNRETAVIQGNYEPVMSNFNKLLDEVFGEDRYVNTIVFKKKSATYSTETVFDYLEVLK
jgi:hypothetical protein